MPISVDDQVAELQATINQLRRRLGEEVNAGEIVEMRIEVAEDRNKELVAALEHISKELTAKGGGWDQSAGAKIAIAALAAFREEKLCPPCK